jgi:hypothetical protein
MVLPRSTRTRTRWQASKRCGGKDRNTANSSVSRVARPWLRCPNNCRRNAA